ncbi:hypothetical protein IAU60_006177 [Kwoniella sp. DSM 27419]
MAPLDIPPDLVGQSGLYNVPDPLLRRLRLEEPSGRDITNLEKYFAEKDVLVLYAGSEFGQNNLRSFHRDLSTFASSHRSASVIYISTDVSPLAAQRVLADKPWLRATFFDNSDFAPIGQNKEERDWAAGVEDVKRGEDFVQAGEMEMGVERVELGAEEYQNHYVRPLSRAAVTVMMSVFATPSIAIYHIPTHTFLLKNAKPSAFAPGQVEKNYAMWRNGGKPTLRIVDLLTQMRWPFTLLILAILYHLAIRVGGDQYNFIPKVMNGINGGLKGVL